MVMTKSSQTYKEIQASAEKLVHGRVLSIDPSIGSTSSMPGWAVLVEGDEVDSGILNIDPTQSVARRLNILAALIGRLNLDHRPEVIVYEKVPVSAHGGRSQVSHASLLMASGSILGMLGHLPCVGLMPISWKPLARPDYVKGDREDAVEMGWIAVQQAREILALGQESRTYGQPRPVRRTNSVLRTKKKLGRKK